MISGEMKKTWWMIEAHSLISVLYWLLTAYRSASSPSIAKERTVLAEGDELLELFHARLLLKLHEAEARQLVSDNLPERQGQAERRREQQLYVLLHE